jgi:hypothetical protein
MPGQEQGRCRSCPVVNRHAAADFKIKVLRMVTIAPCQNFWHLLPAPCNALPAGIDDVTPRQKLLTAKASTISSEYKKCDDFIAAYNKVSRPEIGSCSLAWR